MHNASEHLGTRGARATGIRKAPRGEGASQNLRHCAAVRTKLSMLEHAMDQNDGQGGGPSSPAARGSAQEPVPGTRVTPGRVMDRGRLPAAQACFSSLRLVAVSPTVAIGRSCQPTSARTGSAARKRGAQHYG